MRRFIFGTLVSTALVFTIATPALAAPPIREDGTVSRASAFAGSCETTGGGGMVCTDQYVETFQSGPESWSVCVGRFTYSISATGRFRSISDENGCADLSDSALTIAPDLLTASIAPTDVPLLSCNRRGCTEAGALTVSAELASGGQIYESTNRGTFSDGTCTYRFTSSTVSTDGPAEITVDGSTVVGQGSYESEDFRFTTRC
jgi:hypothetical protein